MKKNKALIAAAAVLVIAGGGYAALMLTPQTEEETIPDVSEVAPAYMLTESALASTTSVTVDAENGYTITVEYGEEESTFGIEGMDDIAYNNSDLSRAVDRLIAVETVGEVVAVGATDLAPYGLDNPAAKVTINGTDGNVSYSVGNVAPGGNEYYAMLDGTTDVYLIQALTAELLFKGETQYRESTVMSFTIEEAGTLVKSFTLERPGMIPIDIVKNTVTDDSEFPTMFYMQSYTPAEANDTVFTEDVLAYLANLSFTDVVDTQPQDLAQYGLDEPQATFTLDVVGQAKLTVNVGDLVDGYYYATVSGSDAVVTFAESTLSFLDIEYIDLISTLLWLHNIKNVESVDFVSPSGQHTLVINNGVANEEEPEEDMRPELDGQLILTDNAREIYQAVLSPSIEGLVADILPQTTEEETAPQEEAVGETPQDVETPSEQTQEDGEVGETPQDVETPAEQTQDDILEPADYVLTLKLLDGTIEQLAFYEINERQYSAVKNGEILPFYVNIRDLEILEEYIQIALSGGEID